MLSDTFHLGLGVHEQEPNTSLGPGMSRSLTPALALAPQVVLRVT